jgi:hypothetical protein
MDRIVTANACLGPLPQSIPGQVQVRCSGHGYARVYSINVIRIAQTLNFQPGKVSLATLEQVSDEPEW